MKLRLVYCCKDDEDKEIEECEITNAHIYKLLKHIYEHQQMRPLEKQLAPQLKGVLEDAVDVMRNPPTSWHEYLKTRNTYGIAHMELDELIDALKEHKSSREVRKELVHAIAALFTYAG